MRGARRRRLSWAVGALAVAVGVGFAALASWLCDDAFISFRYARNLVEGHGLVFNPGERVEGYTNLAWTLWIALGLWLQVSAATWSIVWGIVAYGTSLLILIAVHLRVARRLAVGGVALPVAALLGATHEDWNHFATSGLETSAFTCLCLAGYSLVARGITEEQGRKIRGAIAAGIVFAVASSTRPDGVLWAAVAGAAWAWSGTGRVRRMLAYGAAFLVVWGIPTLWRVDYYGDFFPNTYYAKSAYRPWWDQGWHYFILFSEKYWALYLAPALVAATWLLRRRDEGAADRAWSRHVLLAGCFAVVYTTYVIRVGGDFMFARLLIPVVPYLAILVDLGLLPWAERRPLAYLAATGGWLVASTMMPTPVSATHWVHGVADEWDVYSPKQIERVEHKAAVLKRYLSDLPVRVAFLGAEARVMYEAEIPVAIESATGLTDATIARQELVRRGRPGHEKRAPVAYLIDARKAHFIFAKEARSVLGLDRWIPVGTLRLDDVEGFILHWDPPLMAELRRRGAEFVDFPSELDRFLDQLRNAPPAVRLQQASRIRRFYFDHVDDPRRAAILFALESEAHRALTQGAP